MKNSDRYLKNLLKKSLNESLESKAEEMKEKIKKMEVEEGFDDFDTKKMRGGKDYDKYEFSRKVRPYEFMKDLEMDSLTPQEFEYQMDTKDIDLEDELYGDDEDLDPFIEDGGDDIEPIMEGEMCEQCGGGLTEGECMECGYKQMDEKTYDLNPDNQFDYVEEEMDLDSFEDTEDNISDEDILFDYCKGGKKNPERCKAHMEMLEEEINEKLYGKQKKLDKNKNGKIDAEDFKLLKKKGKKSEVEEEEMEEGNKFSGEREKAIKAGKKEFKVDGKTYPVKESIVYHLKDNQGDIIKLTENELVDLIENIINEQKISGLKTIGKPKGLTTYEKAHKGSGKENQDNIKAVTKKMKDYLKDGSKGKYDMNPKMFPMGNGELGKMDKKAFKMSNDLEDFNYEIAGQNFPVPDAIDYNEDWMEKLFKGDSMTGNAPGGNALPSKTNDRFNKMRKKNTLKKLKDQSYNRVSQPVYNEKPGGELGKGLNIKLETTEKKESKVLNEEFERMKELLSYNRKTQ
jgi:hypothetical protein